MYKTRIDQIITFLASNAFHNRLGGTIHFIPYLLTYNFFDTKSLLFRFSLVEFQYIIFINLHFKIILRVRSLEKDKEEKTKKLIPRSVDIILAAMVKEILLLMMITMSRAFSGDNNPVYDPCSDAKVSRSDGFSFGLAFASKDSFFFNHTQLSPCDSRLALYGSAQLAVFRPKVDEISLLTIDSNGSFNPSKSGGYVVAFAGRQFAARSVPVLVADNSHTITSFTLVLEFQKGTLQNLFWKKFGCGSCTSDLFVCLNNTDCAIPNSKCKNYGGNFGCDIGIQLAFSGTDKNDAVLNSWYEVANLRQYSLYALYSDLRDSISSPFTNLF